MCVCVGGGAYESLVLCPTCACLPVRKISPHEKAGSGDEIDGSFGQPNVKTMQERASRSVAKHHLCCVYPLSVSLFL